MRYWELTVDTQLGCGDRISGVREARHTVNVTHPRQAACGFRTPEEISYGYLLVYRVKAVPPVTCRSMSGPAYPHPSA
jgi:hypothetical protein